MYTEVGTISEDTLAALQALLADVARWTVQDSESNSYQQTNTDQAMAIPEIAERWPAVVNATFIRLQPGDHLYRHPGHNHARYNIPVETNEQAESWTFDDDGITSWKQHLELGKVYSLPKLDHESFNRGATTRTHLILIMEKTP